MARSPKNSKTLSVRDFAQAGLWLSGAAFLAAVILLVIKLLIFMGIYSATNQKNVNLWLLISVGLVLIGLAAFALMDPRKVRNFLAGRQARHGSNAVIMLIAFILILVVINAIVYQNPKQWDLTEAQQNSLAPETINALKAIPTQVHAIGFFTSRTSKTTAETLLNNIKTKSSGKFTFEFIDPESSPVLAQQYKITQDGTIVLLMDNHQELFTSVSEQNFTNSLAKLMNPGERTVYFLGGHGEHNIEQSGDMAYTDAKTVLESKNYTVKTLNLLAENQVPGDALAVIIAGPAQPLSVQEVTLLKNYCTNGGSLVVLADPKLTDTTTSASDPLLDYLASDWNIKVNNDLVIDPTSTYINFAIASSYAAHAITESLTSQNLVSFFPSADSLTVLTSNKDITPTSLVETNNNSWGETDIASLESSQSTPVFDSSKDLPGPLSVAAAAENSTSKGRVVVFGDSDFADDTYFNQYGNSDMFINSVDWAAGQEGLISLTTKTSTPREMKSLSSTTVLLLALAFVIFVPGLVIAGGVASWLVRRSRG